MADADADPLLCGARPVAQAEHDPEARSRTSSRPTPELVAQRRCGADEELAAAGRREIVEAALRHARAVLVRDERQAAEVVDDLAAEHLLRPAAGPRRVPATVRNAGAIFLGPWTAVPFGDYGVASNHVLPTAGTARFSSGLRAADYVTVRIGGAR